MSLSVPVGVELPTAGFDAGEETFIAPPADGSGIVSHWVDDGTAYYQSTIRIACEIPEIPSGAPAFSVTYAQ